MNAGTTLLCFVAFVLCLQTEQPNDAALNGESCFGAKYWITCLIDTCKLGGKCPGDAGAQCRMERIGECMGCKAVWYKVVASQPTNTRADCSVKQNLNLCPGGEPVVHCEIDSCRWPCSHKDFRRANCRQTYCGNCEADYFVQGKWQHCPKTTTGVAAEVLPIDSVIQPGRRRACTFVPCSIEICLGESCPAFPMAICRPDGCNKCQPSWFNDNRPVDCFTGQYLQPAISPIVAQAPGQALQRQCSGGEALVPCSGQVCQNQMCRNHPNAVCSPDGCGQCQATWYVNDQLVDCLSDVCPPGVPYVRCVDDPCKYFSHYCPMAECRASTCGSCEAKFFQNGQEIDCAQPPKACPAGVEPLFCPWHTCPATVCPSNSRLMCRINPCGDTCTHEWIDVFNGGINNCRVFSGGNNNKLSTTSSKNTIFFKDPMLSMFNPKQDKVTLQSSSKSRKPMTEPTQLKQIVKPSVVKSHGSFSGPVITSEVLALLERLADPAMSVSSQFISDVVDPLFIHATGAADTSVEAIPIVGMTNTAVGGIPIVGMTNTAVGGIPIVGMTNTAVGGIPIVGMTNTAVGGIPIVGMTNTAVGGIPIVGMTNTAVGGIPIVGMTNTAVGGIPIVGMTNTAVGGIAPNMGHMDPKIGHMNQEIMEINSKIGPVEPNLMKKSEFLPIIASPSVESLKPIVKAKMMGSAAGDIAQKQIIGPILSVKKAGKPIALTGATIQQTVPEVLQPQILPVKSINPFKAMTNQMPPNKGIIVHEIPIQTQSIKPMKVTKPLYPELQPFMGVTPDKSHKTVKVVKEASVHIPIPSAVRRVNSVHIPIPSAVRRVNSVPITIPPAVRRVNSVPIPIPSAVRRVNSVPIPIPSSVHRVNSVPIPIPSAVRRVNQMRNSNRQWRPINKWARGNGNRRRNQWGDD